VVRRLPLILGLAVSALVSACGDTGRTADSDHGNGGGGAGGAGPSCPPGEQPLDGGSCLPAGAEAGVPSGLCAAGFVAHSSGGCDVVLPAGSCAAGQIALPGDDSCHDLASCGQGTWGDVPLEPETVFVDASYLGGASDGSEQAPWTTISDAIDAAADGTLLAIAAGSYGEDVRLEGKALRLWGRCPTMTEVVGAGVQPAAVSVVQADGVELHGLSVRGPRMGVWGLDSVSLALAQTWIHHTGNYGLALEGPTTSATVSGVLVEAATGGGVVVQGARLSLAGSAVRGSAPDAQGLFGYGLTVELDPASASRGLLELSRSVVETNRGAGIMAMGSDLHVGATVVRDTLPRAADQTGGHGIHVRVDAASGQRGALVLGQSVVERSTALGLVVVGSDAVLDATVVRDVATQPNDGTLGWGIIAVDDADWSERASVTATRSLVERAHGAGVLVAGSDVSFDRLLVRDTALGAEGYGRGFELDTSPVSPEPTRVAIRSCLVDGARDAGILVAGAELVLEGTAVQRMQLGAEGLDGYGLSFQSDLTTGRRGQATVRWCSVEDAVGVGALVDGADAILDGTRIRRTAVDTTGGGGVGLAVQYAASTGAKASLQLRSSSIEDSHEVGILVIGAEAQIARTTVSATEPNHLSEFGDGIAVASHPGRLAAATLTDVRVQDSAVAGVVSFSADVDLLGTTLECNTIQLDGERTTSHDFTFRDLGGNSCTCHGQSAPCLVLSTNLEPPSMVE
jgi:hypothetical protein